MDANILTDSLPFNLRNVLLLIMYSSCIKHFKLFKHVENSNFIIEVLSKIVHVTNKKADFLVYEGETIEELIIVKDGRLSLEVAINMEDPESSIEKYFNVNFQGITTEKELKKIEEAKRLNVSQLIPSKKTKDFDKVKTVLHHAVKKQVNHLLNEGCNDISILDKTKNDGRKKDTAPKNDYLNNEPIRNEKGNFKYIRIIDIIKNENYGGLYMFMRRPSPLSVKVKSKFAELYLIPKKDIFDIAQNYNNIWSKIHKKDFHNMLSIKHKTFITLNKYIESNGLENINLNDITNYECAFDKSRNFIQTKKINIIPDNSYCANPIIFNRKSNPSCNPIPTNNISVVKYRFSNPLKINNSFSNTSLNKHLVLDNQACQPIHTDISQLLTLMAKGNNNGNNNSKINTNSKVKSHSQNNLINLNVVINNNNENNIFTSRTSHFEKKNSIKSFASNFFNKKQRTNKTNEERTTLIIQKTSDILLPTLNGIFNNDKVESIKDNMKKMKQKEKRRKIFSFGKTTAKLFRNNKYAIVLLDKNTGEYIEIENNNDSKIINNDNKNKIVLDNIPDISTDDEYSIHHFENSDLSKENNISFTLESLYKNINIHTNMKYSQDKSYQEKTLKYLTNLIENKNKILSSELNKSSSFACCFTNKNVHISKISQEKNKNSSLNVKLFDDLFELSGSFNEDNFNNSERLYEVKKRRRKENNIFIEKKEDSLIIPRIFSSRNNNITDNKKRKDSIKSKNTNISRKKNNSKKSKKEGSKRRDTFKSKFTFKLENTNDASIVNDRNSSNNTNPKKKDNAKTKKRIRNNKTFKKNSVFCLNSEKVLDCNILNNIKSSKNGGNRRSQIIRNKTHLKTIDKGQEIENKSPQKSQESENKSYLKSIEKSQMTLNKIHIKSNDNSQMTENKSNMKPIDKRQVTTEQKPQIKSKKTRKSLKQKIGDLNNISNNSFNYFAKEEGKENECIIL